VKDWLPLPVFSIEENAPLTKGEKKVPKGDPFLTLHFILLLLNFFIILAPDHYIPH
jgi:hypothetical protein